MERPGVFILAQARLSWGLLTDQSPMSYFVNLLPCVVKRGGF